MIQYKLEARVCGSYSVAGIDLACRLHKLFQHVERKGYLRIKRVIVLARDRARLCDVVWPPTLGDAPTRNQQDTGPGSTRHSRSRILCHSKAGLRITGIGSPHFTGPLYG